MIRKDALCFPSALLHDSRVTLVASQCGVPRPWLVQAYLLMLEHYAADSSIDLRTMSMEEACVITGLERVRPFMDHFVLGTGKLRHYDEYMAPGIKERHGAARRQKAWRERGKAPAPRRVPRKEIADSAFEEAWAIYPARAGGNPKAQAKKAWVARLREGVSEQDMLDATGRYRVYCDASSRTSTEFVMQARTFFGNDNRWREEWGAPAKPRSSGDDVLDTIMSEVSGAYATEV